MRIAVAALAGAILVTVVCLAITPARHWTQDLVVCRGDGTAYHGKQYVKAFGQNPDRYGMICTHKSGKIEGVSASAATLGGVGVSLLLGGLGGALIGVIVLRRRGG